MGWSVMGICKKFRERLKEHLRAPSSIYDHANTSGHHTKWDNFSIVGREAHTLTRTIKEAMYIRANDSSFNRTLGSTSYPTYVMRSCSTPVTCTSNSPYHFNTGSLCKDHNTSQQVCTEAHTLCSQCQQLLGMGSCSITILVPYIVAPGATIK